MDNDAIKKDFNERYRLMNDMVLTQMNAILDPLCKLCGDHQRSRFVERVKTGVRLWTELLN